MLTEHGDILYSEMIKNELKQMEDEGKSTVGIDEKIEAIMQISDCFEREAAAYNLFVEIENTPSQLKYEEPSELNEILSRRPEKQYKKEGQISELFSRIYGAWQGRIVGCMLGKPVEGMMREQILKIVNNSGNNPIYTYINGHLSIDSLQKLGVPDDKCRLLSEKFTRFQEDDDINYTIMGLKILEHYGRDFTPDNVAERWLSDFPVLKVCTAERVAYRNLMFRVYPPQSAAFMNPYREWIGAQIRADFYGYVNVGNPEKAADMAWRDASISHVKNGIYGSMWVAAMTAWAAVCSDIYEIIDAGLSQIPAECRLRDGINQVMQWHKTGVTRSDAMDKIHEIYDEKNRHDWTHTISNAMIVTMALLYGEGDFNKTVNCAILTGFDTDCNAATAGSIIGMRNGGIPNDWLEPFNDTLCHGIAGMPELTIQEAARRTVKLILEK